MLIHIFLCCCHLVVFESLNKFKYHPLSHWLFQTHPLFCFQYCLLYRTQPSLLLAPLFHPFQFSIGQFVNNFFLKPPNLLLYTTNCTALTWVTRTSLPMEIALWIQRAISIWPPFFLASFLDLRWKPSFSEQFQIKPNSTKSKAITVASTMSNSKSSFPDLELPWWWQRSSEDRCSF